MAVVSVSWCGSKQQTGWLAAGNDCWSRLSHGWDRRRIYASKSVDTARPWSGNFKKRKTKAGEDVLKHQVRELLQTFGTRTQCKDYQKPPRHAACGVSEIPVTERYGRMKEGASCPRPGCG